MTTSLVSNRKIRISRFVVGGLTAVALVSLSACGGGGSAKDSATKSVSFLLPGGYSVQGMAVVYAEATGIFKKHGVDVKIEKPSSSGGATSEQYIQQGRFDMGYVSTDELMKAREQTNDDVTAFYGWLQKDARCFLVPQKLGISKPEQLAGKSVGFVTNSTNVTYTDTLKKAGVYDKVKVQNVSRDASTGAYLAGRLDALTGYGFQQAPAFTAAGVATASICESDFGMDYMQAVLGAKKSYLDDHKEEVQAVADSLTEALTDMEKDPTAAIKAFKDGDTEHVAPAVDVLKQEVDLMLPYFKTDNDAGHDWGWMAPQDWDATKSTFVDLMGIKSDLDVTTLYTNEFTK